MHMTIPKIAHVEKSYYQLRRLPAVSGMTLEGVQTRMMCNLVFFTDFIVCVHAALTVILNTDLIKLGLRNLFVII